MAFVNPATKQMKALVLQLALHLLRTFQNDLDFCILPCMTICGWGLFASDCNGAAMHQANG